MLNKLFGLDVIENPYLPEFTTTQIKKHVAKPGQSAAYHRRINKKWRKRFGFKTERAFYLVEGRVVACPKNILLLKNAAQCKDPQFQVNLTEGN